MNLQEENDVQLRHLLFTTAIAAAIAIASVAIYWCSNGGEQGKRRTEEDGDDGDSDNDSVCDSDEETALVPPSDVPQNQVMDSGMKEKERIAWLEDLLKKLKNTAEKMEETLKKRSQHRLQELENSSQELNRSLKKRSEVSQKLKHSVERMGISVGGTEDRLKDTEKRTERVEDSAEEKLEKGVKETEDRMEEKREKRVKKIRGTMKVEDFETELEEFLPHKDPELIRTICQLKAVVNEKEPEGIFSHLEMEKNSLSDELKTQRDSVQEMRIMRCEIDRRCDEIMKTIETEEETYSVLMKMLQEMKETSQKVPVNTAEQEHKVSEEMIGPVESENFVLRLRDSLEDTETRLLEIDRDFNDLLEAGETLSASFRDD